MHYNFAPPTSGSGTLPIKKLEPLDPGQSAISTLTDFQKVTPLVIEETRVIDEALQSMISNGVRSLLVIHENEITGLITSYDIQGERPIQFMNSTTYRRHSELQVSHLMTPWRELSSICMQELRSMSVLRLLQSMKADELTHLLVLESAGGSSLRGIVSRVNVEMRLNALPSHDQSR